MSKLFANDGKECDKTKSFTIIIAILLCATLLAGCNSFSVSEPTEEEEAQPKYLLTKVTATGSLLKGEDRYERDWGVASGVGTCKYDENGNMIEKTWSGSSDVMWEKREDTNFSHTTTYTYDENNRITSEKGVVIGELKGEVNITTTWEYDSKGNIITYTFYDDFGNDIVETHEYTYDDNDNILKDVSTKANDNGRILTYTYDKNGNKLSQTQTDIDGGNKAVTTWEYDEKGNILSEQHVGGGLTTTETYSYNNDGKILSKTYITSLGKNETTTYEYDKDGNCILRTETDSEGMVETTTYEYEDGKKISVISPDCQSYYEYDENGNLSKMTQFQGSITQEDSYLYYPDGSLKQKKESDCGHQYASDDVIYTYDYDENGNLIKYTVERPYANPEYHYFELTFEYVKFE